MEEYISESLKQSLKLYKENHIPTGGFLDAVLRNDLILAVSRADFFNKKAISDIVEYIKSNLDSSSYGSAHAVDSWLNSNK